MVLAESSIKRLKNNPTQPCKDFPQMQHQTTEHQPFHNLIDSLSFLTTMDLFESIFMNRLQTQADRLQNIRLNIFIVMNRDGETVEAQNQVPPRFFMLFPQRSPAQTETENLLHTITRLRETIQSSLGFLNSTIQRQRQQNTSIQVAKEWLENKKKAIQKDRKINLKDLKALQRKEKNRLSKKIQKKQQFGALNKWFKSSKFMKNSRK